jgi:uncharacterized protein (UPF0261 family)
MEKTILVIGTFDTKDDELGYLIGCIKGQGGDVLTMDVSVLGDPATPTDISKHDVAAADDMTITDIIALGDENHAFRSMTRGAVAIVQKAFEDGKFDGMIALGGTMGTDLALDCAKALPLGVPKYLVSTVSGSPLIGADRLAPDIQTILWAGGLYGLNPICKSSLSQAAGAVLGAARAVERPSGDKPLIGMTSLGSSCLKYMKKLHPKLSERGYDVAVFHTTGMGGMAFESLAAEGAFVCVMDFSLQEFVNGQSGSIVNSGPNRLRAAGQRGVPQMVAPGATDILDLAGWQDFPPAFEGRPYHEHNRLIKSVAFNDDERRELANTMAECLVDAKGATHVFLPQQGIEEWDREGEEMHNPAGLASFNAAARKALTDRVEFSELDCHINDDEFCDAVLAKLDAWVADGIVPAGKP